MHDMPALPQALPRGHHYYRMPPHMWLLLLSVCSNLISYPGLFFCRDCWLNWVEFALVRMCLCDLGFTCLDWLWWSVDLGVFVGCWLVSLFGCIFVWSCSSSTSAANFEVDGIWLILVCSWELRLSLRIDLIGILEFRIWMLGAAPLICNTWILIVDRIDLHAKFMLLTPHMA